MLRRLYKELDPHSQQYTQSFYPHILLTGYEPGFRIRLSHTYAQNDQAKQNFLCAQTNKADTYWERTGKQDIKPIIITPESYRIA
jgi:hypothetical protein